MKILFILEVHNARDVKEKRQNSLLSGVDPLQIQEKNPCASSDPSPGTQKPNTTASHYALHPVTCQHGSVLKRFSRLEIRTTYVYAISTFFPKIMQISTHILLDSKSGQVLGHSTST